MFHYLFPGTDDLTYIRAGLAKLSERVEKEAADMNKYIPKYISQKEEEMDRLIKARAFEEQE